MAFHLLKLSYSLEVKIPAKFFDRQGVYKVQPVCPLENMTGIREKMAVTSMIIVEMGVYHQFNILWFAACLFQRRENKFLSTLSSQSAPCLSILDKPVIDAIIQQDGPLPIPKEKSVIRPPHHNITVKIWGK